MKLNSTVGRYSLIIRLVVGRQSIYRYSWSTNNLNNKSSLSFIYTYYIVLLLYTRTNYKLNSTANRHSLKNRFVVGW